MACRTVHGLVAVLLTAAMLEAPDLERDQATVRTRLVTQTK